MVIVTKFLRSCCRQATVVGKFIEGRAPLASFDGWPEHGRAISLDDIAGLNLARCYPSVGSTEALSIKRREFIALLGGVERIGVRLTTHAARNAKPLIRTSRSDRPRHQPCDPE